jgi:hypothetical protein
MTTDDDDRRDELASALLDGDLPDEEAAAARRDPAVVARAAELSTARDRLRDVPPPAPAAREAGLAAALAAFDEVDRPTRLTTSGRVHVARRGLPPWLGAAAGVVVLAGVLGALALTGGLGGSSNDSSNSSTNAASAPEQSAEGDSGSAGAGSAESSSRDATLGIVFDFGDLGDFTSPDALVARISDMNLTALSPPQPESGTDESATTTSPEVATGAQGAVALPGAQVTCRGSDLPEPPVGGQAGIVGHAAARLAGTHVDVWLVRTSTGTRMVALDTSCQVRADSPVD